MVPTGGKLNPPRGGPACRPSPAGCWPTSVAAATVRTPATVTVARTSMRFISLPPEGTCGGEFTAPRSNTSAISHATWSVRTGSQAGRGDGAWDLGFNFGIWEFPKPAAGDTPLRALAGAPA